MDAFILFGVVGFTGTAATGKEAAVTGICTGQEPRFPAITSTAVIRRLRLCATPLLPPPGLLGLWAQLLQPGDWGCGYCF